MSFDRIIILLMALCSLIGGIDRICGNRLKLGEAFENGLLTMGQLALSMIGIIVLSPVIAEICTPIITPVFTLLGADPSVFAGAVLACDMGGAHLAQALSADPDTARLSGILIASMLGATVSFTIPFSVSILSEADKPYAAKGILCGVVTIPFGIVAGGLAAGLPLTVIIRNTVPVLLLSILIAVGLWKAEAVLIKAFGIFGKCITTLATVGLVCGGIQLTTDIVLLPGLGSMEEAFSIVGEIAIVLSGAFPLIAIIRKLLQKPMAALGKHMGLDSTSVAGLIATLANSIATFDMVKDMDKRGKVVNMAFAVSGAFVFGDHLAFTAGFDASMITALIVGKLTAGVLSILAALYLCKEK